MRLIGIIGHKNGGKTTLAERLIAHFTARGLRVASLKRSHHAVATDTPGTDSFRHAAAGAAQVILATDERLAMFETLPEPAPLSELLTRLAPCDIVLAEGWKRGDHFRIEAWRAACGRPPLALTDPTIAALARDTACDVAQPQFDLNDIAAIAEFACSI